MKMLIKHLQYFTELFGDLLLLLSEFIITKLYLTFCCDSVNGQAILESKLKHVKS